MGLGVGAEWVALEGDVMAAVRPCLEAGWAVPVLGWPQPLDDWGLVTGFDLGRGVLCGWPADYAGDTYLGTAPAGELALRLGPDAADSARTIPQAREDALQ